MKKRLTLIVSTSVLILLLILTVRLVKAQEAGPSAGSSPQEALDDAIPIQGRLTDASSNPLSGDYSVTFNLYNSESSVTALCTDTKTVTAAGGLFNTTMENCTHDDINGQQLWMGITVGSDPEMTPRQPIYAVPYAWSLRPGAESRGQLNDPILYVYNTGSGVGLWATSNEDEGVHGSSMIGTGVAGYSITGAGVHAESLSGAAISAGGSGVITSTADIEIAVSPLDIVSYHSNPGVLDFRFEGAYVEVRPSATGAHTVYIPMDLPKVLFGATTKVKSVRICYRVDQAASYINTTFVNDSTDTGTLDNKITDNTNYTDTSWSCYTATDTAPEEIQGSVYIAFNLNFTGTGSAHDIRIGKIILTLTEE